MSVFGIEHTQVKQLLDCLADDRWDQGGTFYWVFEKDDGFPVTHRYDYARSIREHGESKLSFETIEYLANKYSFIAARLAEPMS